MCACTDGTIVSPQGQFIDDVLGTDLLVYLSPTWLSEVFLQVIQCDLLSQAGYMDKPLAFTDCALIELLTGK